MNHSLSFLLNDADLQRLAAALDGLHAAQREALVNALTQVELRLLQEWLAEGKLHEWVKQGLQVLNDKGRRGTRLGAAFFSATSTVLPVLTQGEIEDWVRIGMDIGALDRPEIFVVLPECFADLKGPERLNLYRLVRTAAARSPQAAAALYRSLPYSLHALPLSLRGLLFRCLQAAAAFDPEPLPALLPFLSPTLRGFPPESQTALLERIAQLAQTFPAGVARLFRVLSRAYDEVGEERVKAWIVAGEELARRNPQAGEAFFALESRTSLLMLHQVSPAVLLSEVYGVLLKYLHMLGGAAISIKEADFLSFPPPLLEGDEEALPLPAVVEVFPTYEENFRLYRVLAAQQAGRMEFGTYLPVLPVLRPRLPRFVRDLMEAANEPVDTLNAYFRLFPRPEQIEALFVFIESKRVAARLAATYRGLQEDLAWAETLTHLTAPVLSPFLPSLADFSWPDLGSEATVYDSLLIATELYASRASPSPSPSHLPPPAPPEESPEAAGEAETAVPIDVEDDERQYTHFSEEEQALLQKILAALRAHGKKKKQRKKGATTIITLDSSEPVNAEEYPEAQSKKKNASQRLRHTAAGLRYLYDEWDYLIEDYRSQWCQLKELPLGGDDPAFFSRVLETYAELSPDIKREFQRLRPRLYRHVKGLEYGEEIDLDAAVAARVDLRTGTSPSPKLYAARQPVERDVAALFLLDMSASTDMRLAEREDLRIIDVMKEAVVLLAAALEGIGDAYAIYGFSSHGRRNVEVYPVKTFTETLSPDVQARIGAIAPKRSTRMGAAVRHATRKLKDLSSRAKLLVLLSDGYPEDADYGRDKQTPTYGLRDTMMALREAERNGILSFCLTVDKGGHDYLREMCPPSRYMVIEDVLSLPLELPKIYQRHIRAQRV